MGDVPRKYLFSFLTFRLLALKSATVSNETEARKIALETLDLLVPIAYRLSLGDLRRELEGACFQVLDPQGYADLRRKVIPIQAEDDKCLQILLAGVQRLLQNNNIQGRVQGRTKSLHGIRREMGQTGKILEKIMDRVGFELLQRQVYRDHLVVFGNGGRIVRMADKATVHDYLIITDTQVPKGTAVKVYGNIANMDQPLQDGDSIEVLSSGISSGLQFAENSLQYKPSRIAGRFSSGYENSIAHNV